MSSNKKGAVLVAGGGIAGIQAALDLANSGFYVYLTEKKSAIGGSMSQLDKTFPTNDCSMCIISPKLVEAGKHLNIELMTMTNVEGITGEAGDFKVKLKKEPRYIDMAKCTACGECEKVCPVDLPSQFDEKLRDRKAAFKLYPQAMPSAFTIDKKDKAPCRLACPAGLNIQGYVQMVKQGKYKEALEIIMEQLPLPGVLGRICPHECEDACRRCDVDDPIAIRDLKRLAADKYDPREIRIPCHEPTGKKVAVIGSGPAGLSAAYHLAKKGIKAVIYEALSKTGGMLRVGIPEHRLPAEVLDREIEVITNLGVEIKLNSPLGADFTVDSLLSDGCDAVFLAMGAHKGFDLGIPGENLTGVYQGVDYLRELNLTGSAVTGKNVAIVGGGNVAIDVARSAVRLGADKVTILYRRTRKEMPAWEEEIKAAEDEGVEIIYLAAPQIVLSEDDSVSGIRVLKMELGEPDSSGRRRPIPVPGSEYDIEIDQLIPAIGQFPDVSSIEEIADVNISKWTTTEVHPLTLETDKKGVFAGGDVQTGPGVAIGAIAAGMEAAESISRYLKGIDLYENRELPIVENPEYREIPEGVITENRLKMPELTLEKRNGNFTEVELGYQEKEGQKEAARCLNCGYCSECMQCVDACLAHAVDHSMVAEEVTVDVGAVILSPGFKPFDAGLIPTYSYNEHPNIVTSIEFERILSASGPYGGHLIKPSDGEEPERIAWIQCVGSRDVKENCHSYCSSVCCMYTNKQTVIAKEHSKNDLDATVFFMDMRTQGKEFEKYHDRAKEDSGVRFVRSRIHSVEPLDANNLRIRYATEEGGFESENFDMVVLSIGLSPAEDTVQLAKTIGIELNSHNFAATRALTPVQSSREGIYVCGAFQGPKDIPSSVMEASAAASEAARHLSGVRNKLTRIKDLPPERDITGEEPRIGVFVCNCGINIGGVADVPAIAEYAKTLPGVVFTMENLFACSQDTQDQFKDIILDNNLNRIVVASCSPRTHEPLFQDTIRDAGLNKYLFEMANIRDQNTWVHMNEPEIATQKAKDLVRMAVAKVSLSEPLYTTKLDVNSSLLVVGGGIAGMEASLSAADQGSKVYLVEKTEALGGVAKRLIMTWQKEGIQSYLAVLKEKVKQHPGITIHKNTKVLSTEGIPGNFKTSLLKLNGSRKEDIIEHGATILATGGNEYLPKEYLYGKNKDVLTTLELDEAIMTNDKRIAEVNTVAFIQCVGSRCDERPYCSKICCTHSVKSALEIKERNQKTQVFILYRDIRTDGFREELYNEAREKGVLFIRYTQEKLPVVTDNNGQVEIVIKDQILQMDVLIKPDLLVLATSIIPNENKELFEHFKVPVNNEGFLVEAHAKLRPVDFASDGIFMAGLAHYPKSVEESIAQANAAVSRAMTLLSKDSISVGGSIATVDTDKCAVCLTCVRTCPFGTPYISQEEGYAIIEPAMCHGCGACAAECPGKAIALKHTTDGQIRAKTEALFN